MNKQNDLSDIRVIEEYKKEVWKMAIILKYIASYYRSECV